MISELDRQTLTEAGQVVTQEQWRHAHAFNRARIWDGRRYMQRLDRATGEVVWREVLMTAPLIERHRRPL